MPIASSYWSLSAHLLHLGPPPAPPANLSIPLPTCRAESHSLPHVRPQLLSSLIEDALSATALPPHLAQRMLAVLAACAVSTKPPLGVRALARCIAAVAPAAVRAASPAYRTGPGRGQLKQAQQQQAPAQQQQKGQQRAQQQAPAAGPWAPNPSSSSGAGGEAREHSPSPAPPQSSSQPDVVVLAQQLAVMLQERMSALLQASHTEPGERGSSSASSDELLGALAATELVEAVHMLATRRYTGKLDARLEALCRGASPTSPASVSDCDSEQVGSDGGSSTSTNKRPSARGRPATTRAAPSSPASLVPLPPPGAGLLLPGLLHLTQQLPPRHLTPPLVNRLLWSVGQMGHSPPRTWCDWAYHTLQSRHMALLLLAPAPQRLPSSRAAAGAGAAGGPSQGGAESSAGDPQPPPLTPPGGGRSPLGQLLVSSLLVLVVQLDAPPPLGLLDQVRG